MKQYDVLNVKKVMHPFNENLLVSIEIGLHDYETKEDVVISIDSYDITSIINILKGEGH